MEKVIIDGDWGGDEMQLAAVLLAHPERVKVLGATAVFGNAEHDYTFENGRNVLHFLNADHVKVYPGATHPSDGGEPQKDGAHGLTGIGDVVLDPSPMPRETKRACDFIIEQLLQNDPGTVTLTASGPLSNIAEAIRKNPVAMARVKHIIILGGCMNDMTAHDVATRRGNITYHSEFNFNQAPSDAQTVMKSGLPVTVIPMDCSHQLAFTPEREAALARTYLTSPAVKKTLVDMIKAPEHLDRKKFNSPAVMHDINCALYLLYPENYTTVRGQVEVTGRDTVTGPDSRSGRTEFTAQPESQLTVATGIISPDRFFDVFMQSITAIKPPQALRGAGMRA